MLEKSAGLTVGPWYKRYMWGIGASAMGGIAILIAFFLQFGGDQEITKVPDLRVTIPMLVVAIGLGVMSFVKRERLRALPVAGMALALSACMLGWLIIVAAVAAAAVIAILIIAKVT